MGPRGPKPTASNRAASAADINLGVPATIRTTPAAFASLGCSARNLSALSFNDANFAMDIVSATVRPENKTIVPSMSSTEYSLTDTWTAADATGYMHE